MKLYLASRYDVFGWVNAHPKTQFTLFHQFPLIMYRPTASVGADSNELNAIGGVFGKENLIRIGCVKSNMGSSEPAFGVCGLMKVGIHQKISRRLPWCVRFRIDSSLSFRQYRKILLSDYIKGSGGSSFHLSTSHQPA